MTDSTEARRAREALARHTEQMAYDSGHGHRDISHHRDNRYAAPQLSAAYDRGFADRDAELRDAAR